MKYLLGVVVFALLAVVGYYAWDAYGGVRTPGEPEVPDPVREEPASARYATSTFSIAYPNDFTVDALYQYTGVPNKPIAGVKFMVPAAMAEGTNLSVDSGVSVEWLPRARNCTGDIYVLPDVSAFSVRTATTSYSVATTSEGAAGNFYEEHVYALPSSSPCTAVRYFIHTTNFTNYFPEEGEPAEIREFDRAALLSAFDRIRDSLTLLPASQ